MWNTALIIMHDILTACTMDVIIMHTKNINDKFTGRVEAIILAKLA